MNSIIKKPNNKNISNKKDEFIEHATYFFVKSCFFIEKYKHSPSSLNKSQEIFESILKKYRGYFVHSNFWECNKAEIISNQIIELFKQISKHDARFNDITKTLINDKNKCFQQDIILKILSYIQDQSSINLLVQKSTFEGKNKSQILSKLKKSKKLFESPQHEFLKILEYSYQFYLNLKMPNTKPTNYRKSIRGMIKKFIGFAINFISFVDNFIFDKRKYVINFGKKINKHCKYRLNDEFDVKDKLYLWRDIKIFCNFDDSHSKFKTFFISFETLCKIIDLSINDKCTDNKWIYAAICKRFIRKKWFNSQKNNYNLSKTSKEYEQFSKINVNNYNSQSLYKDLKAILIDYYWKIFEFLFKQFIIKTIKSHENTIKIDDNKIEISRDKNNKLYSCQISYDGRPKIDFSLKLFRSQSDFLLNSLSQWIIDYFSNNKNINNISYKFEKYYVLNHCKIIFMFKDIEDKIYCYLKNNNTLLNVSSEDINNYVKEKLLQIIDFHDNQKIKIIEKLYQLRNKIAHLNVSNKNTFSHLWDKNEIKFLKNKTKYIIHILNKAI